ncbi:MAG: IS66 family transposase [Bryobacteraceae bacterium]
MLRQQRAPAVLESIKQKIEAARKQALPSSKLGQACAYTLGLWGKLHCFLKHPEVELSNNCAENSMRSVAVGRKNWIHVGSVEAGPRVAAILSVVETCRRLSVPVREYLGAVLPAGRCLDSKGGGTYSCRLVCGKPIRRLSRGVVGRTLTVPLSGIFSGQGEQGAQNQSIPVKFWNCEART